MAKFVSRSAAETKRIARDILRRFSGRGRRPLILALSGDLGSGKTTFIQGLAQPLGIQEKIQSPTFVLMKRYRIRQRRKHPLPYRHFMHLDAYRIESLAEARRLGIPRALSDPNALAVVEWADRIKKIVPNKAVWVCFRHRTRTSRVISYETPRSH